MTRREWVAVGILASGAVLLAACSGSAESGASAELDTTPTASSVDTTPQEVENSSEATQGTPADTDTSSGVTDAPSSFFVENASIAVGYPVEISRVLSNVDGDIPADQYTVTWNFENSPDLDDTEIPSRRYVVNPQVDFVDTPPSEGDYLFLCLDRDGGYGGQCTGLPDGFPISIDGRYELYTQAFGAGGQDPVDGTKKILGSFVYTAPKYEEPLKPALCDLTGGTATFDGDDYVVTVEHTGECSSPQTWLGEVQVVNDQSGGPFKTFKPANISEISHSESETVLVVPQEEVQPWFDYMDVRPDELDAFQVMSGSIEPGYEPSTVRIDMQQ